MHSVDVRARVGEGHAEACLSSNVTAGLLLLRMLYTISTPVCVVRTNNHLLAEDLQQTPYTNICLFIFSLLFWLYMNDMNT